MAFGRLRGPRVQELKSLSSHEAGGRNPGRVLGVTPLGLLPSWQFPPHANSCGLAGHRLPEWARRLRWELASTVGQSKEFLKLAPFLRFDGINRNA